MDANVTLHRFKYLAASQILYDKNTVPQCSKQDSSNLSFQN